jgi:hypothetical protein
MREAEKDPEEQKKRRLAEEAFLDAINPFDRVKDFVKRKKVRISSSSIEDNPLGEGPSRLGTSVSLRLCFIWFIYLIYGLNR